MKRQIKSLLKELRAKLTKWKWKWKIKFLPKKPWAELTQKEQQVIRESWKHHLPEVFDVFFIGGIVTSNYCTFPGNLYISGNADIGHLNVGGDCIVEGNANTRCVDVGGDFIVHGNAITRLIDVGGCIIIEGKAYTWNVNVGGDFIVGGSADTWDVNVSGLFDCYDVRSYGHCIYATDFVCRCYEGKNA